MKRDLKEIRRINACKIMDAYKAQHNLDTDEKLAQIMGVTAGYISQIRKNVRNAGMGDKAAENFEKALKLPPLILNEEDKIQNVVIDNLPYAGHISISKVIFNLSKGDQKLIIEKENGIYWLDDNIFKKLNIKASFLKCIECPDNAMQPIIAKGDELIINRNQTDIIDSKIYAILYNKQLRVRRLSKRYDDALIIQSNNPEHFPIEQVNANVMQDFIFILGQVIWRFGFI